MESTINIRKGRASVILDLGGDILTQRDDRLIEEVEKLLNAGDKNIALNLGGIFHISSNGVGTLVKVRFSILDDGGCLKLIVPSPKIRNVFEITHLAQFFEIFASEEEALASFK